MKLRNLPGLRPPPEPRPLVAVQSARYEARYANIVWKIWILRLDCGHEVRRKSDIEPRHARCDACLEETRERAAR